MNYKEIRNKYFLNNTVLKKIFFLIQNIYDENEISFKSLYDESKIGRRDWVGKIQPHK